MPRDGIARVVDAMLASPLHPRALDRESLDRDARGRVRRAARARASGSAARPRASSRRSRASAARTTSEALPGALPRRQNAPRRAPYGLYPGALERDAVHREERGELARVDVPRARVVLARRARAAAGGRFAAPLGDVDPESHALAAAADPEGARARRLPRRPRHARRRRRSDASAPGYAVHLYAANADMADRAFSSADGDLLIVPQDGHARVPHRARLAARRAGLDPRSSRARSSSRSACPTARRAAGCSRSFGPAPSPPRARPHRLERPRRRAPLPRADRVVRGPHVPGGLPDRHQARRRGSTPRRRSTRRSTSSRGTATTCRSRTICRSSARWARSTFDHPDPSILTVLTAPLDDHGRAIADFVVFPGALGRARAQLPAAVHASQRGERDQLRRAHAEPRRRLRPGVHVRLAAPHVARRLDARRTTRCSTCARTSRGLRSASPTSRSGSCSSRRCPSAPRRGRATTPLVDAAFGRLFEGMKKRFDPSKP